MDVSIIIVSYNTVELLDDCITSIKAQTSVEFEIIVVDNNSTDNTLEMLTAKHADVIRIENRINSGFARANNQAIEIAKGKYIFMLNPDTLVLDGAVDKLFKFMEENSGVGICGPKNLGPDLKLQMNCDHYPGLWNIFVEYLRLGEVFPRMRIFNRTMMRYWQYDSIEEVERMAGCSLMISRSVMEAVGRLDDRFFMYFEETDICMRVNKYGYKIVFYPVTSIIHYGGQSALQKKDAHIVNTTAMKYYLPSQYYFFRKHYGKITELLLRMMDFVYGCLLWMKNVFRSNGTAKSNRLSQAKILIRFGLKY
jgi:GT2 family glycosyltransferase